MNENDFELEAKRLEGVPNAALLRLSGKGGGQAVRRLQEAIQPLLSEGTTHLLFDCARLDFFNSTALGYLINLGDAVEKVGGAVAFCRVTRKVQVAFDHLGLQEFFRFFPDEAQAARYFREKAPPRPAPAPRDVDPSELLIALPDWLDEVDQPAPPPLEHPRWIAFLVRVAEGVGTGDLEEICRDRGVPSQGPAAQVFRKLLQQFRTPEELLGEFDEAALAEIGGLFGLSSSEGKEDWIGTLTAFVQQATTESMASSTSVPVSLTHDQVLRTLRAWTPVKASGTERAVRDLLFKHLAGVFGPHQILRDRPVGRHVKAKVPIDVGQKFGIVVRKSSGVLVKKPADLKKVQDLLGQVVLMAGTYGRGNLFVVLAGAIPKEQAAAMGEIRAWLESAGGRWVQVG